MKILIFLSNEGIILKLNLKIEWETVDLFRLAQDTDLWRAVMYTVVNLRLP